MWKKILPMALVLVVVSATIGCADSKERVVVTMMRKMPENTSNFELRDVRTLRGDDKFEEYYNAARYDFDYGYGDYGIDFNDVDYFVESAIWQGTRYTLIGGNFDLVAVRDELDSLGYSEGEYRGVEVWQGNNESLALMETLVILGSEEVVRNCIEVVKEGKDSLWDNQDAKDVVDRLPDGYGVMYSSPAIWAYMYEGIEADGISMETEGRNILRMTMVLMFENEDAAFDAVKELEEETESYELERTDVNKDGKFVIATREEDIQEIIP